MEKWIKGFENLYSADENGNIYSYHHKNRYTMMGYVNKKGYRTITLIKDKIQYQKLYHRIIAETFLELVEGKDQVNHINGIKTDNQVSNLEWCTPSENQYHSSRIGLKKPLTKEHLNALHQGVANKIGRFTIDEASEILEMMDVLKLSCRKMAEIIGIDKSIIQRLKNGETKYFRQEISL